MPSPGISSSRPHLQHAITSPARHIDFAPSPSPSASGPAFFSGVNGLDGRGSLRKRPRRGLTFEEVQSTGVINDEEKSGEFDDLLVSPEEIKKLPRKVCPSLPSITTGRS